MITDGFLLPGQVRVCYSERVGIAASAYMPFGVLTVAGRDCIEIKIDGGASCTDLADFVKVVQSDPRNTDIAKKSLDEFRHVWGKCMQSDGSAHWSSLDRIRSSWENSKRSS